MREIGEDGKGMMALVIGRQVMDNLCVEVLMLEGREMWCGRSEREAKWK